MSVTILVYFDDPFYAILVERRENGRLSVARQVVGPEPSEIEVLAWVQREFPRLRYSPAVEDAPRSPMAVNPKRRQRQAARETGGGVGTRSQQALQLDRELRAAQRKEDRREREEEEAERRFQLRQEKKKARHRGH